MDDFPNFPFGGRCIRSLETTFINGIPWGEITRLLTIDPKSPGHIPSSFGAEIAGRFRQFVEKYPDFLEIFLLFHILRTASRHGGTPHI